MRDTPTGLAGLNNLTALEPRNVVQLSWDNDDTDHTYLTSSSAAALPAVSPAVDSIQNVVLDISGQTQKINPDIAASTIGTVTIKLLDRTDVSTSPPTQLITDKISTKLAAGDGLRRKICRIYVGYENQTFENYDQRLTYVVDNIAYLDGVYTLTLSDIQRQQRHKIFTPDETTLASGISATELIIPVATSVTTRFPLVIRGSETFNFPGQAITFIKIEDEAICINSQPQFDTTNGWHVTAIQRGSLGTRAVEHKVDDGTIESRRPRITEHIYLEGAAPKIIYALLTGVLMHGNNVLADPYDFTTWGATGTPDVTATTDATPTGWGNAYSVTDDDAGAFENIAIASTSGYVHGDTWTISIFVKKDVVSNSSRFDLWFNGGAAASYIVSTFDASTGALSHAALNAAGVGSGVTSHDENWWHIRISAYSTTTGTTSAAFIIYPAVTGVADTGSVTLFCATLCSGYRMGWTALPLHWHLGINKDFVRLSDFQALGDDMWQTSGDTGRWTRIENPGNQDGKKFIESEILLWLGAFMPVYASGELGIRRLTRILSDSGYQAALDHNNVVSYSMLQHNYRSIINQIRIFWNWIDERNDFTKEAFLFDATSIAKHNTADTKEFRFKTVHTGVHTDENLLAHFDTLRDRYSGPPLELSIRVLPSMALLEVGDTVRLTLDQIRDMNTGESIDRTFEIQQITTNWTTGALDLRLFGSSQAAGEIERTTLATVLEDAFYTSEGTSLDSSDSPAGPLTIAAGAVTANGTITGNAVLTNGAAIYYYDGNLTINPGVTVTITENVQLRIKGTLTINGTIDGIANGPTGAAATTQYENGTTTTTWIDGTSIPSPIDINQGNDGYFGIVRSGEAFRLTDTPWEGEHRVFDQTTVVPHKGPATTIALPTKGAVSTLPWFDLRNPNGYTLLGMPGDLRGHGGLSGIALIQGTMTESGGTYDVFVNGGAGGDGGAGLAIVCRGMVYGGAGVINLTGGTSGIPGTLVHFGRTFWAGHGAPGAPGALLVLIDGEHTNPDITTNRFIANHGATGATAGATEIHRDTLLSQDPNLVTHWPFPFSGVFNLGATAATRDTEMSASAHRLQYLPKPEAPAVVFNPGPLERGKYNELLRFQRSIIPGVNDFYARYVDIVSTGSRFVVSGGTTGTWYYQVVRNAKNPEIEQTTVTGLPAASTMMDSTGSRFIISEETYSSFAGRLNIYARTVTTWALEQQLTAGGGGGPAASEFFGAFRSWDETATHLIADRTKSGSYIEYWSRSGATWTFQEVITEPASISANYPSGIDISGDGNWLAVADHGLNGGTVHIYERTTNTPAWELRDSVTVPDYDVTSPITDYKMGYSLSGNNSGVKINYAGTAIAALGYLSLIPGIHAIERQGPSLVHVGYFENDGIATTWNLSEISNNGLLLLIRRGTATDPFYLFRRDNISEGFRYDHKFDNSDDYTMGTPSAMSPDGQFIITGTFDSDINAVNAGHASIWEYYPEAD